MDLSEQHLRATDCLGTFYIHRDPGLSNSELNSKLEQAFLYGLRFPQHQLRMKFFEVSTTVVCDCVRWADKERVQKHSHDTHMTLT